MGRGRVDAVVAPVPVPGEGRHGHQLERGHAQLAQPGEVRDHAVEVAAGRERADVELVQDELVERDAGSRGDLEAARVHHPRGAAHALRLEARARIRVVDAVEHEDVVVASRAGDARSPRAGVVRGQLVQSPAQPHPGPRRGRPDPDLDRAVVPRDRAERTHGSPVPRRLHARNLQRAPASGASATLAAVAGPFRAELRRLRDWEERHTRLVVRLALVVCATVVIDAVGTVLVYVLERHARGTEVHTFFDALFFTTVQLLTVSSQLKNPVTTGGRIVDVALELWAVLVVAGSAGALASFFQTADRGGS